MNRMERIETARLILRPWQMEDAEDLYEYAKNPEVGPNAGWKPHDSIEESREIIKMFTAPEKPGVLFAIEEKENGKVIGSLGIEEDGRRPQVEGAFSLGYVLSQAFWGRGLMTEVVSAAIDYAFQNCHAKLFSVTHYPFNKRSRRVIEKSGFYYEGLLRQASRRYDGTVLDLCCYSMTAAEYYLLQAKKRGLFLILPEETTLEKIADYQAEWGEERIVPGALAPKEGKSPKQWLEHNIAGRVYQASPELVTAHTWFLTNEAGELLGGIDLRHRLTEPLLRTGGNIGYGVRPSCRRKHYAPCMLALCLEKAEERGMERVLVTCVEENRASAAVIEACGGVLENKLEEEGGVYRRYWIKLGGKAK